MALALKTHGNVTRRSPLLTGGLVALCICVFLFPPMATWSVYERAGIAQGEWWRLLTAHLVHFTPGHLIFNLLGLALAAGLLEVQSRRQMYELTGLMLLVIGPVLFLLHPDMAWYGGMSGLVYGYAFYCALLFNKTQPSLKWLSRLVLSLIILKILLDSLGLGFSVTSVGEADFKSMTTSHAAGVITALILYLVRLGSDRAPG